MTKRPTWVTRRMLTVKPGEALTEEHLALVRDPERLISSRHCSRDASGRLIARREFSLAVPDPDPAADRRSP